MTSHQIIALRRRFPGVEVEQRSVSELDFVLGPEFVPVRRPPFSAWSVGRPLDRETLREAPSDRANAHALRAFLVAIYGGLQS
jgi:hypothetical protein